MHQTLFVCTANIFRSRFSEEVYNHLAEQLGLSSTAFSAGLMVGRYTHRTIYYPALEQLKKLNIIPKRENELSIHIDDIKLSQYDKIICMDEEEHKPMIVANSNLSNLKIEYWDIVDEPKVSSHISLPKCYLEVEKLISNIASELI